jgi:hypothetical protein
MSIFLGSIKRKSKLTPKQYKALLKVQKLLNEAGTIWENENLNIRLDNGNKVFEQTYYHLNNAIYVLPLDISSYNAYLERY